MRQLAPTTLALSAYSPAKDFIVSIIFSYVLNFSFLSFLDFSYVVLFLYSIYKQNWPPPTIFLEYFIKY